jgi:hypothetical protein
MYSSFQRQVPSHNFTSVHSPQIIDKGKGPLLEDHVSFDAAFAAYDEATVASETENKAQSYTSRTSLEIEARGLSDDNSTHADIEQRISELHNDYRDERDFDASAPQRYYAHPGDVDLAIEDPRELTLLQNPLPDTVQQPQLTPDEVQRYHDELAATAGALLQGVSHDMSKKFQESEFLALMRRLRDGEVRVEGNDMVEVGEQSVWNEEKGEWVLPGRHLEGAGNAGELGLSPSRTGQDWGEDGETIPVSSQEEAAERRQEASRRFQARRAARDAEIARQRDVEEAAHELALGRSE